MTLDLDEIERRAKVATQGDEEVRAHIAGMSPAVTLALVARIRKLEAQNLKSDMLLDGQFLDGMKVGWNCGVTDSRERYDQIVSGRMRGISEARRAIITALEAAP